MSRTAIAATFVFAATLGIAFGVIVDAIDQRLKARREAQRAAAEFNERLTRIGM